MVFHRNSGRQPPLPSPAPAGTTPAGTTPADEHGSDEHPLAVEHGVLLHEVRNRARATRTALGTGRWPDQEIAVLVGYLREEVLGQTATEEQLLFPLAGGTAADSRMHRLVDDHALLHELTDRLAATVAMQPAQQEPAELVELLDALDERLDGHMRTEQELLFATTSGVDEQTEVTRRVSE